MVSTSPSSRAQTGAVTLDNAFVNTASCESAITFIDGEAGILRYRGIAIEDLVSVPNPSFLETSWLLIYGELPTKAELDRFRHDIRRHTMVHEDVKRFFDGFPKDAHPMATLSSVVTAQSTFYLDSLDPKDPQQAEQSMVRLMAKLPTIAAYAYKKSIGQPFVYPNNELDLIENFLTMMFSVPSERYEVSHTVVNALKKLLILHADHEQNCSTSTVRLVGSSGVNIYATIAAGINALLGSAARRSQPGRHRDAAGDRGRRRRHRQVRAQGERPERPVQALGLRPPRLQELRPSGPDPQGHLRRAAHRARPQGSSPRARACAWRTSRSSDEYFVERKLYPNVDFYSGLIYRAMGFPTQMFTVLFAMGRLPGWLAHWKEMIESPATKIGRPRQIYVGPTKRPYVPVEERRAAS